MDCAFRGLLIFSFLFFIEPRYYSTPTTVRKYAYAMLN